MNENLYAPLRQWPASDIGRTDDYPEPHMDAPEPHMDARPGLHLVSTDHGAAHVCSSITSDSDRDDEVAPMTRGELLALACVLLVAWLAFIAATSVAWARWFQ